MAFQECNVHHLQGLDFEQFEELMAYLGFSSETLNRKDDLLRDAWYFMLGSSAERENFQVQQVPSVTENGFQVMPEIPHKEGQSLVTKRSFVILINIINNVFSEWMAEPLKYLMDTSEKPRKLLELEEDDGDDQMTTRNNTPNKQFRSQKIGKGTEDGTPTGWKTEINSSPMQNAKNRTTGQKKQGEHTGTNEIDLKSQAEPALGVRDEQEMRVLHKRFFAFWEHRQQLEKKSKLEKSYSNLASVRTSVGDLKQILNSNQKSKLQQ